MGCLFADLKQPGRRWRVWCRSLVLLLIGGALAGRPLYGQTVPAAPEPSAVLSPSGSPGAGVERVLALSLEEAIRLALQNNLDIERERFEPRIARTAVERERAAFDPLVGLQASIAQTKVLPTTQSVVFDPVTNQVVEGETQLIAPFSKNGEVTPSFRQRLLLGSTYEIRFINTRENFAPARSGSSGRIVDPRYESILDITFTQPLLRDFGIKVNSAAIRQAQKTVEITEQQVLQVILDTIFAVQQSYWTLVFRVEDLQAQRESQKLAEDFLGENTVRAELGTLAPIELVQAETQVKERQGDVIVAATAARDAEDRLKEVLNLPGTIGTWRLRLRPTDIPPFVPVAELSIEEQVRDALQHRPDYAQALLRIESREIDRDVARHQRLPSLDLQVRGGVSGFGGDAGESLRSIGELPGYRWSVGLQVEYPLGNRAARSELEQRQLEVRQVMVERRQLQLTIVREIREAIRAIESTTQLVEVARATTTLGRTQLEAEQEKFRLGLSTSFQVLTFQDDLTSARTAETQVLSDYNIALARLDQLTGKLQYGDETLFQQR